MGSVGELDFHILWSIHGSAGPEISDVKACKTCTAAHKYIIKSKFSPLKQISVNANITGVANAVAADGDSSAVGVSLLELDFTHYKGVRGVLTSVEQDVFGVDNPECVGAMAMFC